VFANLLGVHRFSFRTTPASHYRRNIRLTVLAEARFSGVSGQFRVREALRYGTWQSPHTVPSLAAMLPLRRRVEEFPDAVFLYELER
jgi:hypothetical protein